MTEYERFMERVRAIDAKGKGEMGFPLEGDCPKLTTSRKEIILTPAQTSEIEALLASHTINGSVSPKS